MMTLEPFPHLHKNLEEDLRSNTAARDWIVLSSIVMQNMKEINSSISEKNETLKCGYLILC